MALNLSMKPTGWFHIGWSAEIAPGGVKPLKYFGADLVAFRSESGELSVLEAHCAHLGAHLGYGGKVKGDAVACPYHGWQWNTQGINTLVPGQDHTVRKALRRWHTQERHGIMFLWHDPAGGAPRPGWELPDLFSDFEGFERPESDYYPCYPDAVVFKPGEPIHPQLTVENAADTMHFHFTHGAPEHPKMLWFKADGARWRSSIGFVSPRTKEVTLTTYANNPGVGMSFFMFDGQKANQHYRLILSTTPIDEDLSDCRVSYFFARDPRSPAVMPESVRAFARETVGLFEEDARIWRHQKLIHHPIFARQDVAGYTALRKWSEQFYEAPGHLSASMARMKGD
jgi:3-ketosteroid 9alpha-monooxygenase subunit A